MSDLATVYARIPAIACQGKCQKSCGPIAMARAEWEALGRPRPAEVGEIVFLPGKDNLTCHLLTKDGRCGQYENRPLICRLWGVTDGMRCPWGCTPERVVSKKEARAMLMEVLR